MASPTPLFQRFITRVHRRYVLIHVVEHGVVGLAFGAVAGIILTAILIWRRLPAESVAITTPLLGLVLGLMRGVSSRPKRMETVTKADQQLRLADLLGSAFTVPDNADWAYIIRSQADAVCRRLSPSDVILHRLGVRVWGGAGLASALLCALALIPTSANPSLARQNNQIIADPGDAELIQSAALPRPTATQADPDSAEHSRFGDQAVDVKSKPPATASDGSDSRPAIGKQAARGVGTASADASDPTHLKLNAGKNPTTDGHTPAEGSGTESAVGVRADSAGPSIAGNTAEQALPPWKSSAWAAQNNQVQSNLRAGHVPDAYRDMLSDYFDAH